MGKSNYSSSDSELTTCQPDPRFQYTNVTNWCFTLFVDHQKCTRLLGKKHGPCDYFARCYKSICPNAWVKRWEDQIEDGIFPVDLPDQQ